MNDHNQSYAFLSAMPAPPAAPELERRILARAALIHQHRRASLMDGIGLMLGWLPKPALSFALIALLGLTLGLAEPELLVGSAEAYTSPAGQMLYGEEGGML